MVVMLCTAARGGMRSVVEGYRADGLFSRHDVRLLFTHDEGSPLRRVAIAASAYLRFVGLLLTRGVDLVHAHVAMRGSFWRKMVFAVTARRFGVPVVLHLHGSEMKLFHAQQPPWRQRLIARQLEASSRVLVLSRSWMDFVSAIAPAARVEVVPNYVGLPPKEKLHRPQREHVSVLFLGLIGQRKGVYDLIPALDKARRLSPAIRLRIGGNGETERVERQITELGLADHVSLLGWVSGDDKQRELAQADIFVLPSYNEGLPMSVLEAMAWGLPVITTRVGGIPELVDHESTGVLVDPGDIDALADALVRLAGDPVLRAAIGAAARERVESAHAPEVVLGKLDELYRALGRGRPARP